jgi:pimeloyl-ACP methyl ester carboxylesterase
MKITSYISSETRNPWPELISYAKVIQTKQRTLFYYDTEYSPSEITLVCIHGLGDEADSFRHIIPLLKNYFRVIAFDLPGFGRSRSNKKATMKNHIKAVEEILAMINGPVVLLGSSMGAIIAEAVALRNRSQVKAVILIDGAMPAKTKPSKGLLFMALPFLGPSWYKALRKNHEAAYQSLAPFYADLENLPQADKDFLRARVIDRVKSETQRKAFFSSLRSLISYMIFSSAFIKKKIRNFPGKILILWGEEDSQMPLATPDYLLRIRPDAQLVTFPETGHLPHQEKPKETANAILQFMKSV